MKKIHVRKNVLAKDILISILTASKKVTAMIKILIVDDERDVETLFVQRFRRDLRNGDFNFHFAFSGEEALQYMSTLMPFDIVMILSDINMPGMTGLELISIAKQKFPTLKIMMISAYGDQQNVDAARNLGADDFVTKPVDFNMLRDRIVALSA